MPTQPGLYFVGLHFLNALSSSMIHGVGRDAERVARQIAQRATAGDTAPRTTLAGTVAAWLPGPPMSD